MSDNKAKATEALKASGFPFQTAISHIVASVPRYSILMEEHSWRDSSGADHFMDIVAQYANIVLTIECKKTQKETFSFLNPGNNSDNISGSLCVHLNNVQGSTPRLEPFAAIWYLLPTSFDSSYCVVSTSESGKDRRLLERDAQALIRGTDAIITQHKEMFDPKQSSQQDRLYLPLIVTNAPLFVASYDPKDISLETGQFTTPPTNIAEVPWVRFTKSFTTTHRGRPFRRTIFVINSGKLKEFLTGLQWESGRPPTNAVHVYA